MKPKNDKSMKRKSLSKKMYQAYQLLIHFFPPEFIAAMCDLGVGDKSAVAKRICFDSDHPQRIARTSSLLRTFLLKFVKSIEIIAADIIEHEVSSFGSPGIIPKQIEEDMDNLLLLMVSNQQARQDLMNRLVEIGRFPQFLFPDRTARSLFSTPWIRRPGYYASLKGRSPKLLHSQTRRIELPPVVEKSSKKATASSPPQAPLTYLRDIALAIEQIDLD